MAWRVRFLMLSLPFQHMMNGVYVASKKAQFSSVLKAVRRNLHFHPRHLLLFLVLSLDPLRKPTGHYRQ